MKKIGLIFILLIPVFIASSGPIHLTHAGILNGPVFDYFQSEFTFDYNYIDQQELEYEFYLGSVFPDIFRIAEDYKGKFNYNNYGAEWSMYGILTICYYLSLEPIKYSSFFYPLIPVGLVSSIVLGYVYHNLSDRHNRIRVYLEEHHSDLANSKGEYDLHLSNGLIIKMMTDLEFMNNGHQGYAEDFFFLLGMIAHNIEDLYVDLFWHSTLSDEYGFGDFTSDDFTPLQVVETYLDLYGFYEYSSNEVGLFCEIFKTVGFWTYAEVIEDYNNNRGIITKNDLYQIEYDVLYSVIDESARCIDINSGSVVEKEGVVLDYENLPSIFFVDFVDKYDDIITDGIDKWSGQTFKGKPQAIKKSLITQLYDPLYRNKGDHGDRFISLPEMFIYTVNYHIWYGDEVDTLEQTNDDRKFKYSMNDDSIIVNAELVIPIYERDTIIKKLDNKDILIENEGENSEKIKIKISILGNDLHTDFLIKDSIFNLGIEELSLKESLTKGREKVRVSCNINRVLDMYSLWTEISILTNTGWRIFYTNNINEFYQDQIIHFRSDKFSGRRKKMQIMCTNFPVLEVKNPSSDENPKNASLYNGDYCLLNTSFEFSECDYIVSYPDRTDGGGYEIIIPYYDSEEKYQENNYRIDYDNSCKTKFYKDKNFIEEYVNRENIFEYIDENFENGDRFTFTTTLIALETPYDEFMDMLNKLSSSLDDIVNLEQDGDNIITEYDEFCIWSYSGEVIEIDEDNKVIHKLDEQIKRLGEGPILMSFNDKTAPFVQIKYPIKKYITNGFNNSDEELQIECKVKDFNCIARVEFQIRSEDDSPVYAQLFIVSTHWTQRVFS